MCKLYVSFNFTNNKQQVGTRVTLHVSELTFLLWLSVMHLSLSSDHAIGEVFVNFVEVWLLSCTVSAL